MGNRPDLWMWFNVCVCFSHLALPPIPPPSPPHPPGHRTSDSAGDTRQTPDPLSSRFSWPETTREGDTEEECVRLCVCVCVGVRGCVSKGGGKQQQEQSVREDAKLQRHSRGENEALKESHRRSVCRCASRQVRKTGRGGGGGG